MQNIITVIAELKNASLARTTPQKTKVSQAFQPNPGMGGSKKQQFIRISVHIETEVS